MGYSPYYILFGRHPIFRARIQALEGQVMPSVDDAKTARLFIDERAQIFKQVLPLAMRNLAIA